MATTPGSAAGQRECKRPGCGNPLPADGGRGRHRVFCSDECARRYHNDARLPVPAVLSGTEGAYGAGGFPALCLPMMLDCLSPGSGSS